MLGVVGPHGFSARTTNEPSSSCPIVAEKSNGALAAADGMLGFTVTMGMSITPRAIDAA